MATRRPASTIQKSSKAAKASGTAELHQTSDGADDRLTTNHGVPISDNQNTLKAGPRGPSLLEDFVLREKIQHFDHERIPERIVHARGSAAHGYFELTKSLKKYTNAKILTEGWQEDRGLCPLFDRGGRRRALWTHRATCAALQLNSIRSKAIGTSLVTTFRSSSFRTPSNFPTSSMRSRWKRTADFRRPQPPTTRSGTS